VVSDTRVLLWAAIEDYAGLWESVWELRAIRPGESYQALLGRARRTLQGLLEDRLIELYRSRGIDDAMTLIPIEEASNLLSDEGSWREPEHLDSVTLHFSATSAGEAAYRALVATEGSKHH
jgi:hypothetical protein